MPLEVATYIHELVVTNPAGSDLKNTLDNHDRLIKTTLKNTFPNITGALTPTHTTLNKVGVTQTIGNNTTDPASTAFVQEALASVSQATATVVTVVSLTTQTAVAGTHYILTNVAATTVTLPLTPPASATVWITVANALNTNVVARNGQTIMGLAENLIIDNAFATVQLRFVSGSWRLI